MGLAKNMWKRYLQRIYSLFGEFIHIRNRLQKGDIDEILFVCQSINEDQAKKVVWGYMVK